MSTLESFGCESISDVGFEVYRYWYFIRFTRHVFSLELSGKPDQEAESLTLGHSSWEYNTITSFPLPFPPSNTLQTYCLWNKWPLYFLVLSLCVCIFLICKYTSPVCIMLLVCRFSCLHANNLILCLQEVSPLQKDWSHNQPGRLNFSDVRNLRHHSTQQLRTQMSEPLVLNWVQNILSFLSLFLVCIHGYLCHLLMHLVFFFLLAVLLTCSTNGWHLSLQSCDWHLGFSSKLLSAALNW